MITNIVRTCLSEFLREHGYEITYESGSFFWASGVLILITNESVRFHPAEGYDRPNSFELADPELFNHMLQFLQSCI